MHPPSRRGAVAARRAHNPKVGGSNPPAATTRQHPRLQQSAVVGGAAVWAQRRAPGVKAVHHGGRHAGAAPGAGGEGRVPIARRRHEAAPPIAAERCSRGCCRMGAAPGARDGDRASRLASSSCRRDRYSLDGVASHGIVWAMAASWLPVFWNDAGRMSNRLVCTMCVTMIQREGMACAVLGWSHTAHAAYVRRSGRIAR